MVGSFVASDNTCEICQAGYQSRCIHNVMMGSVGTQAELARIPLADGTLVATPVFPDDDLVPSLLAASDVLGTGWFAAVAAEAGPGKTVAVVGDGAVGLLASWPPSSSARSGSSPCPGTPTGRRWPASSAPPTSSPSAATTGVAKIKDLTGGYGAHSVVEAVGTQESMWQAIHATRPGGHVGYVGVTHGVELNGLDLFFTGVHLHGGPAPVRRFLPDLIDLIWDRRIDPGKVFDLDAPARGGSRRLPGHGRAPRDQGAADARDR